MGEPAWPLTAFPSLILHPANTGLQLYRTFSSKNPGLSLPLELCPSDEFLLSVTLPLPHRPHHSLVWPALHPSGLASPTGPSGPPLPSLGSGLGSSPRAPHTIPYLPNARVCPTVRNSRSHHLSPPLTLSCLRAVSAFSPAVSLALALCPAPRELKKYLYELN